jgi:hypothetical protein
MWNSGWGCYYCSYGYVNLDDLLGYVFISHFYLLNLNIFKILANKAYANMCY